ncbi:hypothetical protein [Xiashengella succiniciproducens]|jgi:hypothetical protein|uniref:Uncharacterized protein n=1 Tax=Xiashengella succiniciproducens TaxID=2949635 RepID=A0A9J6ZMI7_9BACT|nr:hypothetical protein [Alkaliflexus sp. Ai-910]URW79090.1 hypothetical protein M9189_09520 [Alkaliflexus sp. Ai-910]
MNLDEIKIYLPKFLSAESDRELFKGLKDFPDNIDERLYTTYLHDTKIIYQGDGLNNLLVVNLPKSEIKPVPGIILSNTCDIDLQNERNFPSQIVYAPIFSLEKYRQTLLNNSKKTKEQITDHINAIKKQEITQIFYLPKFDGKLEESIVFLDRVNNMPNTLIERDKISSNRIFTLSDYGAYLFLLKLSIHFTRVQDKVERKSIIK